MSRPLRIFFPPLRGEMRHHGTLAAFKWTGRQPQTLDIFAPNEKEDAIERLVRAVIVIGAGSEFAVRCDVAKNEHWACCR